MHMIYLFYLLLYFLHVFRLVLSQVFILIPHHRKDFELKNLEQTACRSFKQDKVIADFCFEVSSEGELEQVRPLFLYYLHQGKKMELIFSSPSVESKCIALQSQYPEQVRIFRLPLITPQFLNKWITAPVVLFCRYDFFPELLLLKLSGKKFILLSGAVKKNNWFKSRVFGLFDIIVAATTREAERFKNINPKAQVFSFDFRIQRINERWMKAPDTLSAIPVLQSYLAFLKTIPQEDRIIIGSAWPSDLAIFNNSEFIEDIKKSKVHILLVPHQLGKESIRVIQDYLIKLGLRDDVSVLSENKKTTAITILNMSGVLCELYGLFSESYIGGGYERSIHSVFEPFFSGNQVYVGPKIHRSTEYDLLAEIAPHEIHVLFHPEQFYTIYMNNKNKSLDLNLRNLWRLEAAVKIEEIAKAITQVAS